jgi:hypothetical protein
MCWNLKAILKQISLGHNTLEIYHIPKACDRWPWNEWKIECHFKIDKIYVLINLNKKLQYVMVGA